jgi:NAD(P)-dependent dehydrogenase (short-subunit alcohol dehydrogenase family)
MSDSTRRWMITGVSTGIGRSLMEAALERGERVVGTVRSRKSGGDIEASAPGRAKLIELDVTDPASVERGVAEAVEWLGGLDILVNNAGCGVFGPIEVCGDDDFAHAMEVNYFGLLRVTRAALPHLRASQGNLVNVASMAAFVAMAGTAPIPRPSMPYWEPPKRSPRS